MIQWLKNIFKQKNDDKVLINILTRTAGRPVGFDKCYDSVRNQTFRNVRFIVSYDTLDDYEYLKKYDVEKLQVDRDALVKKDHSVDPETGPYSPHNLYCNELLKQVQGGWIMFLDDDDMLAHEKVLENLVSKVTKADRDTILIWQMKFPDGTLIPQKNAFKIKKIQLGCIGSPCFLFHSKYAKKVKWDSWKCADYRFFKELFHIIPKKIWIEEPFVLLNNFGDSGNRNDI
ncbi:glycosyltransferase family A protein [Salegentibacter agarivorans]